MTTDISAEESALFDVVADVTDTRLHSLPDEWCAYEWSDIVKHRAACRKTASAIDKRAKDENRDLTDDEQNQFDKLIHYVDGASEEMNDRDARGKRGPYSTAEYIPGQSDRNDTGNGPAFRDLKTGEEIRGLTRGDKMPHEGFADPSDELRDVSVGDLAQGLISGKFPNDGSRHLAATTKSEAVGAELRTMAEGTNSLGGFVVPSVLSSGFIDLARNQMSTMKAGAVTVPMTSQTLDIGRIATDPTASWKNENAALSSSDTTLERVQFTARTLGTVIKLSRELWEDSPNISNVINRGLSRAMALEMDRVALVGSGSAPEPQGIWNSSNVQTYSASSTATYSMVSQAVEKVRIANHEPNAMIARPQSYGTIDRLIDSQNQPLRPPPSYAGLQHFPSMQVPLDTNQSPADEAIAFVGDFSNLLFGTRTTMSLAVSTSASDASDDAFPQYQIWVGAWLRIDVQLAHPEAFCVIEDILP